MTTQSVPAYVTPDYLSQLQDTLISGTGSGEPGQRCSIQEVRAWLELDPSTDACPDCVCPTLHALVIRAQDQKFEWRREIALLLPRLVGSRGSAALTQRRAYRCADWAIRTVAPFALETASCALAAAGIAEHPEKLAEHARRLRELPPVDGPSAADAARYAADAADVAAAAAAAARYAADAARYAADAADVAAAAAARYAARYADVAAARYAADAADVAAAADAAAAPSPVDLIRELLDMTEAL